MQITGPGAPRGFDLAGAGMPTAGQSSPMDSFGKVLGQVADALEQTQARSNDVTQRLALGQDVDLHEVLTAMQMESISFQLAIQARNHLVETVNTVMNMQV